VSRKLSSDYFEIRFRTEAVVTHWPGTFVIISAYATTGETWTRDANEAADGALAAELSTHPGWQVRITGYSPTTGHAELLTSNRPVDDWGKLLGDTAAVTALLDRLLHHAHVIKCGPRSWRTKIHTDLRAEAAAG